MKRLTITLLLLLSIFSVNFAQSAKGVIRGTVINQQTQMPVIGASVVLLYSEPLKGTVTDVSGRFQLTDVPVGRQSLLVRGIGFISVEVPSIVVQSGKDVDLNVSLKEDVTYLEGVEIKANDQAGEALNEFATTSVKSFSLDETTRFAGAWNDPARAAANFAGVAPAGDVRNDIVIRGNSPSGVMYRLDGVPVFNPNHFGSAGNSGGAISMLSQNILSTSDFFSGAFPSEYGNAISGVFDINLRKGNAFKREYAAQFGFRGMELTAEGPFKKGYGGSYLINYRYSTLAVFDALGLDIGVPAVPSYQDLSVKIDLPLNDKHTLSIFGLGGDAEINLNDSEQESPKDFFYIDNPSDLQSKTASGTTAITLKSFFNKKSYGKLSLAYKTSEEYYRMDTLAAPNFKDASRFAEGTFREDRALLQYTFNHKFNVKNSVSAGVLTEQIMADYDEVNFNAALNRFEDITKAEPTANLTQTFLQWQHRFSNELTINLGLHTQTFSLNNETAVEPRFGLEWQFAPKHRFNAGFGMHSQTLPTYAYFIQETRGDGSLWQKYRNTEFMKSIHYVVGYQTSFADNWNLKTEIYYQDLYNVPVEKSASTFSVLNTGSNFDGFPDDLDELVNEGTGRNYGIEMTLERAFSKGFYFLATASLFDSKYKGSDGVLRNTAFNGKYVLNVLGGKEFNLTKDGNSVLGINVRMTLAGGKRFTPIDTTESQKKLRSVYMTDQAFSGQFTDYFRPDLKISYTKNRPKTTHQMSLDIQNVTNNQNIFQELYSVKENELRREFQQGFLPEFQYKILF